MVTLALWLEQCKCKGATVHARTWLRDSIPLLFHWNIVPVSKSLTKKYAIWIPSVPK